LGIENGETFSEPDGKRRKGRRRWRMRRRRPGGLISSCRLLGMEGEE